MSKFAVILPAAGKSSRFKDDHYKKPYISLAQKPVWLHSAEKFINRDDVKQVILVISPDDKSMFQTKFAANAAILGVEVAIGGAERADSVQNALAKVSDDVEYICIHDAARPCLADKWIDNVFKTAKQTGAAILGTPVTSTIKRVDANHKIEDTVSRDHLWLAQTPQAFRKTDLLKAFAGRGDSQPTDEAQLMEQAGHDVTVVEGSPINIKITSRADLKIAEQLLKAVPKPNLLGPAHPFADDNLFR